MGLFGSSNKVSYKKVKEEGCLVTLSIEVPFAKVEEQTHNQLLRIQARAKLPGFRPGKAPIAMVSQHYMGHAREEAFETLAREHVPGALKELALSPVAPPTISDIDFKPSEPLQFKVNVEIPPRFTARDYTKIPVVRRRHAPTDSELERRLEELREGNARLEKTAADRVGKTHYAVIDFSASREGKPLSGAKGEAELVDMSSDQTIAGLAEGLLGMERGQSKSFPVQIGGQPALMEAKVLEIKEKILPPLDAEFAKDMGFPGVAEFKDKLREVMEKEGVTRGEREVSRQLEEALLKANRFPVPPSLVTARLERQLERLREKFYGAQGAWPENELQEIKGKLAPEAENEVRMSYILASIAEKEKLEAKEEEVAAEKKKSLEAARTAEEKEDIERLFADRRDAVSGMLRERKTLDFIREKAVITDEK